MFFAKDIGWCSTVVCKEWLVLLMDNRLFQCFLIKFYVDRKFHATQPNLSPYLFANSQLMGNAPKLVDWRRNWDRLGFTFRWAGRRTAKRSIWRRPSSDWPPRSSRWAAARRRGSTSAKWPRPAECPPTGRRSSTTPASRWERLSTRFPSTPMRFLALPRFVLLPSIWNSLSPTCRLPDTF